jgi:hypothetical protein
VAELYRAVASLRLSGDELDPDALTARLGVEPTMSYAMGDEIPSRCGRPREARTGFWSLDTEETSPADLNSQVQALLARLPADLDLWADLDSKFEIDLFCGWFMNGMNEGTEVTPETLIGLGQRRITLSIDLYGGPEA